MARPKTLRQELLEHTVKDERHHEETQATLLDLRKCIDALTKVTLDGFAQREELSVAKRKATIGDEADKRRFWRSVGKKLLIVLIGLAGTALGMAIGGC